MRPPSANFRNKASTFHSISAGGRLVGLLKKISYSIFKRRNCESRRFSSSSVVTGLSSVSLVERCWGGDVPVGHQGDGTKVSIEIGPSIRVSTFQLTCFGGIYRRTQCVGGVTAKNAEKFREERDENIVGPPNRTNL